MDVEPVVEEWCTDRGGGGGYSRIGMDTRIFIRQWGGRAGKTPVGSKGLAWDGEIVSGSVLRVLP